MRQEINNLQDFINALTTEEFEGLNVRITEKSEQQIAEEVNRNLRETIEEEYDSEIVSGFNFNYHPKNNHFHTIFKLENGSIIDTLMIIKIETLGMAINIKHREILK